MVGVWRGKVVGGGERSRTHAKALGMSSYLPSRATVWDQPGGGLAVPANAAGALRLGVGAAVRAGRGRPIAFDITTSTGVPLWRHRPRLPVVRVARFLGIGRRPARPAAVGRDRFRLGLAVTSVTQDVSVCRFVRRLQRRADTPRGRPTDQLRRRVSSSAGRAPPTPSRGRAQPGRRSALAPLYGIHFWLGEDRFFVVPGRRQLTTGA